jgi:hypothetical protein
MARCIFRDNEGLGTGLLGRNASRKFYQQCSRQVFFIYSNQQRRLTSSSEQTLMKLMRRVALLSMTLFSLLLMAEQKDPPSDRELAGVTSHGRMMAEYDIAAWHATDAVRAVVQPGSEVKHAFYIARKGERGWTVVLGN